MNIEPLRDLIEGEVSTEEQDLLKASLDASVFTIKPAAVLKPKDSEDVKALVKYISENKTHDSSLSLTPRSAGTDMSGGPLTSSLVLDMTAHFDRVLSVREGFAEVEPGVYYRDFEKETLKSEQLMPSYPASRELCTVGGMVANNAGGEKSLSYGKTEKYVRELSVVLSDGNEYTLHPLNPEELEEKMKLQNFEGEIYRKVYDLVSKNYDKIKAAKPNVSKNSAGYFLWNVWDRKIFDLTQLITGSQGTLGIITKITFRLVKTRPHSQMVVILLKDLSILGNLVATIRKFEPETFESYDDKTFKLALKFLPAIMKRLGGNFIKLAFQFLPELWLTITGGIPKLVLIAEFAGDDLAVVREKAKHLKDVIEGEFKVKVRMTRNPEEARKYWVMRRESFSLLREKVKDKHTAPFIDDIVVRPDQMPEFLSQLNSVLEPYRDRIVYTIAGHAGDGNFHIIPLMNLAEESQREIIPELSDKVYALVTKFKGSIDGEHNDGIIRTPYLEQMYGKEIVKLFAEVKNIFDPQNIFNPGKKVGGKVEDIVKYMKRS